MTEQQAWDAYCAKRDKPEETREVLIAKLWELVDGWRALDADERDREFGTDVFGIMGDEVEAILPPRGQEHVVTLDRHHGTTDDDNRRIAQDYEAIIQQLTLERDALRPTLTQPRCRVTLVPLDSSKPSQGPYACGCFRAAPETFYGYADSAELEPFDPVDMTGTPYVTIAEVIYLPPTIDPTT